MPECRYRTEEADYTEERPMSDILFSSIPAFTHTSRDYLVFLTADQQLFVRGEFDHLILE
jgi:hypothetical protein